MSVGHITLVFCHYLFRSVTQSATEGYNLKPREVRTIRRTVKDLITIIPTIIILIIPLSPIGHVLSRDSQEHTPSFKVLGLFWGCFARNILAAALLKMIQFFLLCFLDWVCTHFQAKRTVPKRVFGVVFWCFHFVLHRCPLEQTQGGISHKQPVRWLPNPPPQPQNKTTPKLKTP